MPQSTFDDMSMQIDLYCHVELLGHDEIKLHAPSQWWEIIWNANIILCFLRYISTQWRLGPPAARFFSKIYLQYHSDSVNLRVTVISSSPHLLCHLTTDVPAGLPAGRRPSWFVLHAGTAVWPHSGDTAAHTVAKLSCISVATVNDNDDQLSSPFWAEYGEIVNIKYAWRTRIIS